MSEAEMGENGDSHKRRAGPHTPPATATVVYKCPCSIFRIVPL